VTNKSASTAVAQILQDGVMQTNPMRMTFVTGTDPGLVNTAPVPDTVQIHTETVTIPAAVRIPPYSVERLEWCVLPEGGPRYLDGGSGDGSAPCGDYDHNDEKSR